ncbi:MAG: hypothetical protein AAFY71_21715 [Bacteroidota bacterium]
MKLLIRLILLFTPIVGMIMLYPYSPRTPYEILDADGPCFHRTLWVYDRIHHSKAPIDIAFIGTSHTVEGIDDAYIQQAFDSSKWITNLGQCFLGRNQQFEILSYLLKEKEPKKIILELIYLEETKSHQNYYALAPRDSILMSYPYHDWETYLNDVKGHFIFRIHAIQHEIFHSKAPLSTLHWGFSAFEDTNILENLEPVKNDWTDAGKEWINLRPYSYWRKDIFLHKMIAACQQKGVEIEFLYVPTYYAPKLDQDSLAELNLPGRIRIPPSYILNDPHGRLDAGHMNMTGARKLSRWLVEEWTNEQKNH